MGQPVPESSLLGGVSARDDVDEQSAARQALEGRCLLSCQGRIRHTRPESHQETKPASVLTQGGRDKPCILAVRTCGSEDAVETQLIRGPGHLDQIVEGSRPRMSAQAGNDVPTVTRGGQEPVHVGRHDHSPDLGEAPIRPLGRQRPDSKDDLSYRFCRNSDTAKPLPGMPHGNVPSALAVDSDQLAASGVCRWFLRNPFGQQSLRKGDAA